jgi:glutamate formiminotransferase
MPGSRGRDHGSYTGAVIGLVECVPNASEGRRAEVVDAMASALVSDPEVTLLDRTSDVDHDRSVFTLAGPGERVAAAVERLAAVAVARIDLRVHRGQHPRLGALDVVPFVPLADTPMAACVALARETAARLAVRFSLPVYLYAEAATRPERRVLADIRRPQFEGLAAAMAGGGWDPDFGPTTPHPTAGATVVGARPFLVAWNIQLDTPDVGLARRIARAIRERDGGLPRVQALGLELADLGCAQVSMNLLDVGITPMWRVWDAVERLAAEAGVLPLDSELIGLAPLRAFTDVADHLGIDPAVAATERMAAAAKHLRLRGFRPSMALEIRLRELRAEPGAEPA